MIGNGIEQLFRDQNIKTWTVGVSSTNKVPATSGTRFWIIF